MSINIDREDLLEALAISQPSTYIIYYDSGASKYKATGTTDNEDTDLATLMQWCHDQMTGGGTITLNLTGSIYSISSKITISNPAIYWQGVGHGRPHQSEGTCLQLANGVDDHMFQYTAASVTYFGGMRNFSIDGNSANQTGTSSGINLDRNFTDLIFENMYIRDFLSHGVDITNTGSIKNTWLKNLWPEFCTLSGITFRATGTSDIRRIHIIGCNPAANTQRGINIATSYAQNIDILGGNVNSNQREGIYIDGASHIVIDDVCVTDNSKNNADTYPGIYINDATDVTVTDNISTCLDFTDQKYGVQIAGTSDYLTIANNNCRGNQTAAYATVTSAHSTFDGRKESPTPTDLSAGSAETQYLLHTEQDLHLVQAHLLYTEASSANAGVTLEIGKEADRNYYYTGTSEVSKAQWYTNTVTLLQNDIAAGDTVTFYNPGGKTGTGEIICIIEYLAGA